MNAFANDDLAPERLRAYGAAAEGSCASDISRLQRLCFWFAAASPHVIAQPHCRVDWARQTALGAMVAAVAGLALAGATLASYYFLWEQSWLPALLTGAAWASVILTLDRLLLASSAKKPSASVGRTLALLAPRVGLAIIVAIMVSVPFELVIFRHQLDVQVAVDHEEEVDRQQRRLDARYADIAQLQQRRQQLLNEIEDANKVASTAFENAMCEGAGTCGSRKYGSGFLYPQELARAHQLKARAAVVGTQNERAMQSIDEQITHRQQLRERELQRFDNTTTNSDDLLTRLLALGNLERDPARGSWVREIVLVIRLFFVILDVLPITSKVAFRGAYDAAYVVAQVAGEAHFDALAHRHEERARTSKQNETALRRASADLVGEFASIAAKDALTSEEGKETLGAMQREILRRIRETVSNAFESRTMDEEIEAAVHRGRAGVAQAAFEAEQFSHQTNSQLDEAVREAQQSLRANEKSGGINEQNE